MNKLFSFAGLVTLFCLSALLPFGGQGAKADIAVLFCQPANAVPVPCSLDASGYPYVNVAAGTITISGLTGTYANNADNVVPVATGLLGVQNFNMVYDGTGWDRLYGDSTNGLFANIKTSVLPTGASTSAAQTTAQTSLSSIVTNTSNTATSTATTATQTTTTATNTGTTATNTGTIATNTGTVATNTTALTTGSTPYHLLSTASTNSTNVKASAGTLFNIAVVNTTGVIYYLKFYDKASAPTCNSDTPVLNIPIPANTFGAGIVVPGFIGFNFTLGIGFCLTGALADNDNTNAATGVAINLGYK